MLKKRNSRVRIPSSSPIGKIVTMPGHILNATCGCGFKTNLEPGYSEVSSKEFAIAYNADYSAIKAFSMKHIERKKLQIVIDPFLITDEEDLFICSIDFETASDEEKQKFRRILMKKEENVSNTYLCPRCKNQSMFFHFAGFWD